MAEGMKALEFEIVGNTQSAVGAIGALKGAIQGLNKVKIGKLGLDSLAAEIDKFASALNKIDVEKVNSLQTIADGLESIRESAKGGAGAGFKSITDRMSELVEAAKEMDKPHLTLAAQAIERLANIGNIKIPKSVGDGLKNIADATKDISPQALENLDRMTSSLQKLQGVDLKGLTASVKKPITKEEPTPVKSEAKEVASQYDDRIFGGLTSGVSKFAGALVNAKSALGGIKSAFVELGSIAKRTASFLFGPVVNPLKQMGSILTDRFKVALSPFRNLSNMMGEFAGKISNVGRSLARIAMYRALRFIIKEITQALKEGTENLYQWSKAVGGATTMVNGEMKTFAQTMDDLSSSSAYLKNSIGAAVAPFISALAPAIDFAIGKIVALINVINQLMALLGGGMGWNKATYNAKEYGKAAGGAGGAAKEALKYLAPFDELNVLPDDNKGGGGGGASEAYEDMFEYMEEFSDKIANFAQMVKDAWASGDWHDVGVFIGDKLNEAINNVPWADIGATLGKAINALIGTKYWTLSETDFVNLGNKIAEFFNNALENIHFDIAGRLQVRELTAIIDTVIGFLEGLDWKLVGKSIGDYLKGAFAEITDWFEKTDFNTLGTSLVNGLFDMVSGLDLKNVAIGLWNALISAVQATVSLSSGLVETLWNKIIGFIEGRSGLDLSFLKINLDGLEEFINEQLGGLKLKPIEVPAEGKITNIKEDLPKNKRQVNGMIAQFTDTGTGGIPKGKKTVPGMTGQISEVDKESLTPDQKTIPTTANFTDRTQGRQFNTTFSSKADFKERVVDSNFPSTFPSEAVFKKRSTGSGFSTKFDSIGNFVSRLTGGKFSTTFSSIAEFKDRLISGLNTIFNSKAKFTSSDISSLGTPIVSSKAKFIDWLNKIKGTPEVPAIARVTRLVGGGMVMMDRATGGVFAGGRWHDVTNYASGGYPKGSQLFWAREAGPELVGTLGGHTAVMNNDQIVASVSAGVARAISGIRFQMNGMPVMAYGSTEPEANEDAMYRAFRRALDETDFSPEISIDGEPLYRSVVRYNNQNTRATGVNQLATA